LPHQRPQVGGPVVPGSKDQEGRLAETAKCCRWRPPTSWLVPAAPDLDVLLRRRRRRTSLSTTNSTIGTPLVCGRRPLTLRTASPCRLALRRVSLDPRLSRSSRCLTTQKCPLSLAGGAWNSPAPGEHLAVMRPWPESHGARLVDISSDVVEMHVARPPSSRSAAMTLAEEQYAYCSKFVLQGTGSIDQCARGVVARRHRLIRGDGAPRRLRTAALQPTSAPGRARRH